MKPFAAEGSQVPPSRTPIAALAADRSSAEEVPRTSLIEREELKEKLDRGNGTKLVMVLGEWAYRAKHIPGSLHFDSPQDALAALDKDDEIVVYDSNPICPASLQAYKVLKYQGYRRVRRYAGGLEDWEEAGYPLEGELVG